MLLVATPTDSPPALEDIAHVLLSYISYTSPSPSLPPPSSFLTFLTSPSLEALTLDFSSAAPEPPQTSTISLDAPPQAIASIATALADFSYPGPSPPEQTDDEDVEEPPRQWLNGVAAPAPVGDLPSTRKRTAPSEASAPSPLPPPAQAGADDPSEHDPMSSTIDEVRPPTLLPPSLAPPF